MDRRLFLSQAALATLAGSSLGAAFSPALGAKAPIGDAERVHIKQTLQTGSLSLLTSKLALENLMLSRRTGQWTRVLVDVEDYRGRRERQLVDLAARAAERVVETGKMLQLEPMPALERRWIHLALRDHDAVATQSIGEEPNRRVVVLPRS